MGGEGPSQTREIENCMFKHGQCHIPVLIEIS